MSGAIILLVFVIGFVLMVDPTLESEDIMGMFDLVTVEVRLPDGPPEADAYQTKSFDNCIDHYVLAKNGELYREIWEREWVEIPTSPIGGYFNKVEGSYRREYLTNFHGDIIFYTSAPMKQDCIRRDYTARFTNGKLKKIWYEDKQY